MLKLLSVRRFLALAAVLAVAGLFEAAALDEVHTTDGKVSKGTVTKDTVEGVALTPEGTAGGAGSLTIPADKVESIVFDVQSGDFQQGMRDMNSGDYVSAAQSFHALLADDAQMRGFREVCKPYLAYLVGECLYRAGKHQDAVTAFESFMKDYKTSRYVPLAVGNMVDSAIQSKRFEKVPDLLRKLEEMGGENKARALLLGAELDLVQNNAAGAEAKYNQAASSSASRETQALARLGLAKVAILKKDSDKAKKMAEQALSSSASPAVVGTAYLIIGDVLAAEAAALKGEPAKEKLVDAALAYMRIPVLFPNDKNTEPQALFKAGECFEMLAKYPDRKSDRDRATQLYNTVIQRYKATRWGADAQASLKKLK